MDTDVLPWLEYRWTFDAPVGLYRALCERLRGTPVRLEECLASAPPHAAVRPEPALWSIHDHAGHLSFTERLWQKRIQEYLRGAQELTAADMSNAATESADLNARPLRELTRTFRSAREVTMRLLDPLTLADASRAAHHPRLNKPMRLVDLCSFAAEHDDHHLAMIRALLAPAKTATA